MIDYIVYKDNGKIVRTGKCIPEAFAIQAQSGQNVMEGIASDHLHMIVDGKVVDKPPQADTPNAELQAMCIATLRDLRNELLLECDWTQTGDTPLTDSKKAEWATYRQALRDLPSSHTTITDITSVNWPSPPEP